MSEQNPITNSQAACTVADIMSRHLVGVRPDRNARDALRLMVSQRVSAVPVVTEKGRCLGMLSARDLLEMACEFDEEITQREADDALLSLLGWEEVSEALSGQRVSDLMTDTFHSVIPTTPIPDAARLMIDAGVHRLPVVEAQSDMIVGIVSTTDIVRTVARP